MSPTLNGSFVLQRFKRSNTVELCNGMMFNFYPGLPHVHTLHTVCTYSVQCMYIQLASYPGHVGGRKSGLVSTVCACANNSGNFSRTSPIMDKLQVVVMRRNNQTRYTACSVAAVFTRRWLPLSETQAVTRQGLRYNYRQFHRHCGCS